MYLVTFHNIVQSPPYPWHSPSPLLPHLFLSDISSPLTEVDPDYESSTERCSTLDILSRLHFVYCTLPFTHLLTYQTLHITPLFQWQWPQWPGGKWGEHIWTGNICKQLILTSHIYNQHILQLYLVNFNQLQYCSLHLNKLYSLPTTLCFTIITKQRILQ